ncbi:MAG: hypothetical protein HYX59_08535 [Elusimicrobia bacterium]|nr:hypothetical protein [Elusimicrobiota bacterium]
MAHARTHYQQALHNKRISHELIARADIGGHDWAITACFYALIHYFEAILFFLDEKHSESSIPRDANTGKQAFTTHTWRERLIEKYSSPAAAKTFSKMRNLSQTMRYLSNISGNAFKDVPAIQVCDLASAKKAVDDAFRDFEMSDSLRLFIDVAAIQVTSGGPIDEVLIAKILKSKVSLQQLKCGDPRAKGKFSADEWTRLAALLQNN